jgi:hypothetical protein
VVLMSASAAALIRLGADEVMTVPWSLVDESGAPVVPDVVEVLIGSAATPGDVVHIEGGTGIWRIDAAAIVAVAGRSPTWHFRVTVGDETRRPAGMSGRLVITN